MLASLTTFLLEGNKFMPEMYSLQTRFNYSTYEPFTKTLFLEYNIYKNTKT